MAHSFAILHAALGWRIDWMDVQDGAAAYKAAFPGVKLVRDGRPCPMHFSAGHTQRQDPVCVMCPKCFSSKGRGITLVDALRTVERGGLIVHEFLSFKSASIGKDGKLPSWLGLTTGNLSTLQAIQDAICSGTPLWTVVWASRPDEHTGSALVIDLAPIIRAGVVPITEYPDGNMRPIIRSDGKAGYPRGRAPETAYHRWASWQKSGEPTIARLIELGAIQPTEDSVWNGEAEWKMGAVRYPQLTVGISKKRLAQLGVTWHHNVHVRDLPVLVDSYLRA
jgi:hypothetical protein